VTISPETFMQKDAPHGQWGSVNLKALSHFRW